MSLKQEDTTTVNDTIVKTISALVSRLKYGSILVKVHDSRIVQIEVTEKSRFGEWFMEKGGGI